jgi:Fic family protein
MYIYESPDWPNFTFRDEAVAGLLGKVKFKQGLLLGKMHSLGLEWKNEAILNALTEEVVKSSAIEGEILENNQVRSSIARRLGIAIEKPVAAGENVDSIVVVTLDASQHFEEKMTKERLFQWYRAMFPRGFSGVREINTGAYRSAEIGNMQIVSGAIGHERVHFQATHGSLVAREIDALLAFINGDTAGMDMVIKAAIVHLWFVAIHPFEDGNGRIARALTDMLLARSEGLSQRFYSMSARIKKVRNSYYKALEITGKTGLDISDWIVWFLENLSLAMDNSEYIVQSIFKKFEFWQRHTLTALNDRQRKILNKLFDGFRGKLTTTKWAKICNCSQDTASRDVANLMHKHILVKLGEARATHYELL